MTTQFFHVKSHRAVGGTCRIELDNDTPLDHSDFYMGTLFVERLMRPYFPNKSFDCMKVGPVNFSEIKGSGPRP